MESLHRSLKKALDWNLIWEKRDIRVDGWPLTSSPWPTIIICLVYVYLVKVLGPKFMNNREPYNLKKVLMLYNAFQILLSTYIFIQGLRAGWGGDYSFLCEPVDFSDDPKALLMLHCVWVYYLSKFSEFLDTFFFIARKKFRQVSLLHVYHHGIMPINAWLGVRFLPGGHGTFFGLLNTFVHILMYTYYLLAGLGPRFEKYLWWKKYLTGLQMIQFVLALVHSCLLFTQEDCAYPVEFAYLICFQAVIFLILFSHFYFVTYIKPTKKINKKEGVDENSNTEAKKND
nr:elongation of very long chain fatty acids protein 3 [Apocyclops royi]